MATMAFQLTSITQQTVTENLFQPNGSNAPPTNPSQAPGVPAQRDTVTLTPQSAQAQGQQTQQNQQNQQPQFQLEKVEVFVLEAARALGTANNSVNATAKGATNSTVAGAPTQNINQTTAAQFQAAAPVEQQVPTAQAGGQAAVQAIPVPTAITAGADATNNSGPQTPQQQLNQLDQALQQLGVDPNSISLFNRLALLLYANDPAALAAFVQQVQGSAQQNTQQNGAPPAVQAQPPTQSAQNNAQTAAQLAPPAQGAATQQQPAQNANALSLEVTATQFTFAEVQGASQGPPANQSTSNQAPQNTNGAASATNAFVVQFQELQLAFAAGAGQGSAQTSGTTNNGNSINVTI